MCIQEDRSSYSWGRRSRYYKSKSSAASKRENDAVEKFRKVVTRHRNVCKNKQSVILLLSPDEHLTGPCYTTFLQKVKEIGGYRWTVKRSVATDTEMLRFNRKSKGYWIFVICSGGKSRECDCGMSETIVKNLPSNVTSLKPVEKLPAPKSIKNVNVAKLNQVLLKSYREKELEDNCACGKRKREDVDNGNGSSIGGGKKKDVNKGSKTSKASSSSSTTTTTTSNQQDSSSTSTVCEKGCKKDYQMCVEYLLAKREKEIGLGFISSIQVF